MTAKEYFVELREMREDIECARELRQEYLDRAISITARTDNERVQTSRSKDGQVGKYSTLAADIERDIERDELQYIEHEKQIIKQIRSLRNKYYIQVLFKVYVQFKSIKAAASEMNMSYPYVREIHRKALAEFERVNADAMEKWKRPAENH